VPVAPPLAHPAHRRPFLRALAILSLAVVAVGCGRGGASTGSATATATTTTTPATTATTTTSDGASSGGVQPQGFTTATARVTTADGEVCEVCVWLADSDDEHQRGLMGVTDLGDAVGMLFAFDEPVGLRFYMYQTPMPLSIAWFAADGSLVGEADMSPCLDVPSGDCPLYSADAAYRLALETPPGALPGLGIGEGSRLELVAGSEAPSCPARAAATSAPAGTAP
jgi:uncharacterized membrane protein (UPF0127 family)